MVHIPDHLHIEQAKILLVQTCGQAVSITRSIGRTDEISDRPPSAINGYQRYRDHGIHLAAIQLVLTGVSRELKAQL